MARASLHVTYSAWWRISWEGFFKANVEGKTVPPSANPERSHTTSWSPPQVLIHVRGSAWSSKWFQDFKAVESEINMISSFITCSVDNTPSDVHLELIDLQYRKSNLSRYHCWIFILPSKRIYATWGGMLVRCLDLLTFINKSVVWWCSTNPDTDPDNHHVLCISTSDIQPDLHLLKPKKD